MLGYHAFIEDPKPDKTKGRSRPMNLAWWRWDEDVETIEKLFSKTDDSYIPYNVIGIQNVGTVDRIDKLNTLIIQSNKKQQSNVLMIYRFYDVATCIERVWAYYFTAHGQIHVREGSM